MLLWPSPSHQALQIGFCRFIQHNIHLLTLPTVNTTCKVPLIFNVTINCFENKFSHVEMQQKRQEADPGATWGPRRGPESELSHRAATVTTARDGVGGSPLVLPWFWTLGSTYLVLQKRNKESLGSPLSRSTLGRCHIMQTLARALMERVLAVNSFGQTCF